MNNTITYHLQFLKDKFNSEYFTNDEFEWKIIKIGDVDHDYEPDHISTINYVKWDYESNNDLIIVLHNLIHEILPKITKWQKSFNKDLDFVRQTIYIQSEYRPEKLMPILYLCNKYIKELSKYDFDISIKPWMNWYVDGSSVDGKIFAKYEKEI